ncbi:MAG: sensor histidine kinase [Promethearchaeota archaeon]
MVLLIKRVLNFFFIIRKNDPEDLRKRKVLNILLIVISAVDIIVLALYISFLIFRAPIISIVDIYQIINIALITITGCLIIFLINNYSSKKLAIYLFLIFFTILIFIADNPYELVLGRSLLLFTLPIIMAGFLIKPFASFIVSFFVIFINLFICFVQEFIPNPISLLVFNLIAFFTWFSGMNLEKSIKKYQKAYKRENFYKDLFVHDTNNILQNILMAVELFDYKLKNSKGLTDTKILNLIKIQIERSAHLIDNIRIFDALSKTEHLLKRRDFNKDLEQVIEDIKLEFKERDLNIQIQLLTQDTSVIANKFLIDVFKNILINAIIYNDNKTIEIIVRISTIHENNKKFLKAEFIDNGIGIPESLKENIFNREIDEDESISGSGLGLTLIKSILDKYKARIWVENKLAEDYTKGSNFILLFPETR